MSVRAKMYVTSIELFGWATAVKLRPVTKGNPENEAFFAATPNGEVTMTIKNELAAEQFAPGQEFYVDFVAVPAEGDSAA